eukprot:TRINITY_DN5353_c0_g3_i2.p1 TRINITY_DN5353_c0_g3~~TRINITY_DN5353_c0_g3_i2.p1  ORF type:complete len:479 (+),score=73.79 TRINITY_DN5353_c0_g3_i2:38-1438(+)
MTTLDLANAELGQCSTVELEEKLQLRSASSFEIVNLSGNGISSEQSAVISRLIAQSRVLKTLTLNGNAFGERIDLICNALSELRNPHVDFLGLNDNRLPPRCVDSLSRLFASTVHRNLRVLHLSHNLFNSDAAKALAGAGLPHLVRLRELDLSFNPLGSAGAVAVLDWAVSHSSLETLSLDATRADDECIPALHAMFTKNFTLQSLSLQKNALGSATGEACMKHVIRHTALTMLRLNQNSIGPDILAHIQRILDRTDNDKYSMYTTSSRQSSGSTNSRRTGRPVSKQVSPTSSQISSQISTPRPVVAQHRPAAAAITVDHLRVPRQKAEKQVPVLSDRELNASMIKLANSHISAKEFAARLGPGTSRLLRNGRFGGEHIDDEFSSTTTDEDLADSVQFTDSEEERRKLEEITPPPPPITPPVVVITKKKKKKKSSKRANSPSSADSRASARSQSPMSVSSGAVSER